MRLISLTTDFGLQDGYVGVMHAVIYQIAPEVKVIDISHAVPPQAVLQGGLTAIGHVGYFPAESVHVIVVDPGVGTARRPIAAKIGTQYYVVPDNGLLTPMIMQARKESWEMQFVHLDNPEFWLDAISSTFHARDIFSPVGAHMVAGRRLDEVGTPIDDPIILSLPQVTVAPGRVEGEIISIDHFGNLSSNVQPENLAEIPSNSEAQIEIGGTKIKGFDNTFGEAEEGDLIAVFHSDRRLGVSVVNGNAQDHLSVGIGEKVIITW